MSFAEFLQRPLLPPKQLIKLMFNPPLISSSCSSLPPLPPLFTLSSPLSTPLPSCTGCGRRLLHQRRRPAVQVQSRTHHLPLGALQCLLRRLRAQFGRRQVPAGGEWRRNTKYRPPGCDARQPSANRCVCFCRCRYTATRRRASARWMRATRAVAGSRPSPCSSR